VFAVSDPINAFVPGLDVRIKGADSGPLAGLTFAAKDLFDVAGFPTGGGNPDWQRCHPVPEKHAWAVETLLNAGAELIGKTITDEVSLGILGENPFYGTPVNSAAPDRVPGGSSSGSASAVAGRLCDFAIGTDTGGSVRVPASFCGLFGMRPTHGRMDLSGMLPQAPSSDTAGWFSRDAKTFTGISSVLLGESAPTELPSKLLVAVDAFGFACEDTRCALDPMVKKLSALIGNFRDEAMAPQGLSVWSRAQRTLQPAEAWATFKDWVDRENPRLAFNVARGLLAGSMMSETALQWARLMRREARARLDYLLPPSTILCLPTTPFPAPKKGLPLREQNTIREQILCLCAHGGLTGVPQISIPGADVDGAPVGLSIIGGRGMDASLVAVAVAMERA
jgi:amidase